VAKYATYKNNLKQIHNIISISYNSHNKFIIIIKVQVLNINKQLKNITKQWIYINMYPLLG
jgi:hypothetical protein